jgi:hypothetical protein
MTTLTAAAWMKISAACVPKPPMEGKLIPPYSIGTVGIAAPALLWKTLPGEADLAKVRDVEPRSGATSDESP